MSETNLQVPISQDTKTLRGTLVRVLMKLRKINSKDLAEYCKVSIPMINQVIWGTKRSKSVEENLNKYFGVELFK